MPLVGSLYSTAASADACLHAERARSDGKTQGGARAGDAEEHGVTRSELLVPGGG